MDGRLVICHGGKIKMTAALQKFSHATNITKNINTSDSYSVDTGIETNNDNTISLEWSKISQKLLEEFGEIIYGNWISKLNIVKSENSALYLSAPSKFALDWIVTNYSNSILKIVQSILPEIQDIIFIIDSAFSIGINAKVPDISISKKREELNQQCDIFDYSLDTKLVFENFIVSNTNYAAYNAAISVASGNKMNLLSNLVYLHSNVGMGKTHLLQSIAHHIKNNNPEIAVVYLTAEKFTHMFLKYLKANDLIGFKEKLKSCDILLVDDLQFICGKNATSHEFSNILSALTESNKIVIVAADVNPFILKLDPRSKSRLIGGLVIEISDSDVALRQNILKAKCDLYSVNLADHMINKISNNINSSNRELEGAIRKLAMYCDIQNKEPMNDNLVDQLLFCNKVNNIRSGNPDITPTKVIKIICDHFKITEEALISKSRMKDLAIPRQMTAYLLKICTNLSMFGIAQLLGRKDHTSIIYFLKQVDLKIKQDVNYSDTILLLQNKCNR